MPAPTLAEVLAATAGSDEPADDADEPAPEWLTTARELVTAGSSNGCDNWEAGNY